MRRSEDIQDIDDAAAEIQRIDDQMKESVEVIEMSTGKAVGSPELLASDKRDIGRFGVMSTRTHALLNTGNYVVSQVGVDSDLNAGCCGFGRGSPASNYSQLDEKKVIMRRNRRDAVQENHPLNHFARRLATAMHFLLSECKISKNLIQRYSQELGYDFYDCNQAFDLIQGCFVLAQNISVLESDSNHLSNEFSGTIQKLATENHLKVNSRALRKLLAKQEVVKDLISTDLYAQNHNEYDKQEEFAHAKPILTVVSNVQNKSVSEDFLKSYINNLSNLVFTENDIDVTFMNELRSFQLNMDAVAAFLCSKENKHFDPIDVENYKQNLQIVIGLFNDHGGEWVHAKLKSHILFWRMALQKPFDNLFYINLIDNLLFVLIFKSNELHQWTKLYSMSKHAIDFKEKSSLDIDDFKSQFEEQTMLHFIDRSSVKKPGNSKVEKAQNEFSTLGKIDEKAANHKAHKFFNHISVSLLMIGCIVAGMMIVSSRWVSNMSSVAANSFAALNEQVNQALKDSIDDFISTPYVINSLDQYLIFQNFNSSSDITNSQMIQDYFVEILQTFPVQGLYAATSSQSFCGAVVAGGDVYKVILNDTSYVPYIAKTTKMGDGSIQSDPFSKCSTCSAFDLNQRPWFALGKSLSNSSSWTAAYDFYDIFSRNVNQTGLTLVDRLVYESNGSVTDIFIGVDVYTSYVSSLLASRVSESWSGVVFAVDSNDNIYYNYERGSMAETNQNHSITMYGSSILRQAYFLVQSNYGSITAAMDAIEASSKDYVNLQSSSSFVVRVRLYDSENGIKLLLVSGIDSSSFSKTLQQFRAGTFFLMVVALLVSTWLSFLTFQLMNPDVKFNWETLKTSAKQSYTSIRDYIVQRDIQELNNLEVSPRNFATSIQPATHIEEEVVFDLRHTNDISSGENEVSNTDEYSRLSLMINNCEEWFFSFAENCLFKCSKILGQFWNLWKYVVVQFGVSLIVLSFILVWIIWVGLASSSATSVADLYLAQFVKRYISKVSTIADEPISINQMTVNLITSALISSVDLLNSTSERKTRDITFQKLMKGFKTTNSEYMVDAIYVGFESNGLFSGAQYSSTGSPEDKLVVMARDSSNNYCYSKYIPIINSSSSDYLSRNMAFKTYTNPGCNYDPRLRVWYTTAKTRRALSWSALYTFSDGSLGITLAQPFYTSEGSLFGVAACDLRLERISSQISALDLIEEGGNLTKAWIMNVDGALVATSSGNAFTTNSDGSFSTMFATESSDSVINSTSLVLTQLNDPLFSNFSSSQKVSRTISDPVTFEAPITQKDTNLYWVAVLTGYSSFFYGNLSDDKTIAFLSMSASIAGVLYLVSIGFTNLSHHRNNAIFQFNYLNLKKIPKNARIRTAYETKSFQYWRGQTDNLVKKDALKSICSISNNEDEEDINFSPIQSDEFIERLIEKSLFYLKISKKGYDTIHFILLESLQETPWIFRLYNITLHPLVSSISFSVVFAHIILSFWKPPTLSKMQLNGVDRSVIILEGFLLFIEIARAISDLLVILRLINSHSESLNLKENFENSFSNNRTTVEDEDFSRTVSELMHVKFTSKMKRQILFLLVIAVVLVDWIMIVVSNYSIEYFIPVRVLLVVLMNDSIRKSLIGFVKTVVGAKNEFILYLSNCLFAAITGSVLFRTILNANEVKSSYSNIIRSLTTSFIFFSTGANYADLVFPAFDLNSFYVMYFVFLFIIGNFVVLAFVLSSFVRSFQVEFQRESLKRKQKSRSGIFAAFTLLDLENNNRVSKKILESFFDKATNWNSRVNSKKKEKLGIWKTKFVSKIRNLESFVDAIEDLEVDKIQDLYMESLGFFHISEKQPLNKSRQFSNFLDSTIRPSIKLDSEIHLTKRRAIFERIVQPWFTNFVAFLVILQSGILTFYGLSGIEDSFLDSINLFFVIFFTVELFLKLYAYGYHAYFNPTSYKFPGYEHLNKPEYEVANRLDFLSIMLALISNVAVISISGSFVYQGKYIQLRFGMSFLLVRIFTQIASTRRLIYPIFMGSVLKQFVNLLFLLGLVLYIFGIYGTLLFHDKFSAAVLQSYLPSGNFDNLSESFLELLYLLINFDHSVMYAAILVTDFNYAWFFIVYVVVVTLLFTNIFISLILTIMEKFGGKYKLTKRDIEKLLNTAYSNNK